MKEAAHLVRLAGVLFAGTVVFLLLRAELVPDDFGRLGHYRAGALADVRNRPLVYAGRATCAPCHQEILTALSASKHDEIGCEACHGPLLAHADDLSTKVLLPDATKLCVRCHEKNSARPQQFPQVISQEHANDVPCITCHQPHSPGMGG